MGAVKVRGYSFAKAIIWMGLASVLILTLAVFTVKYPSTNTPPSINNISRFSSPSSSPGTSAAVSDAVASVNNKKLNDSIVLSDAEKVNRDCVKAVSDIKTDDPLQAVPSLKQILVNKNESPAVKTLALSKLIEINT